MGMLALFLVSSAFVFITNGYGYESVYPMNGGVSESKYDSQISKYDVGYQTFRFKPNEDTLRCEETPLKEREAILADIKSGRMKMKRHPDYKSAIIMSPDFATGKEYLYIGNNRECNQYISKLR